MSRRARTGEVVGALGLLALVAGLGWWVWGGDWRWAATGVLAFVALVILGSAIDRGAGL